MNCIKPICMYTFIRSEEEARREREGKREKGRRESERDCGQPEVAEQQPAGVPLQCPPSTFLPSSHIPKVLPKSCTDFWEWLHQSFSQRLWHEERGSATLQPPETVYSTSSVYSVLWKTHSSHHKLLKKAGKPADLLYVALAVRVLWLHLLWLGREPPPPQLHPHHTKVEQHRGLFYWEGYKVAALLYWNLKKLFTAQTDLLCWDCLAKWITVFVSR